MKVYLGTAGWSYPDWEGAAYRAGSAAGDRLRAVAEHLDCVEVDSSYYAPPTPVMTANWVRRTGDRPDFQFLAKAWKRFTHERATPWSDAEFRLYADGLTPLRESGRLAAVLFQFPWSFRNEPGNRDWLARVADAFAGWPVAVEVRHDSWDDPAARGWMRERGVICCNVDQPRLSHCLPAASHATSDTGYFRLHGRNATNWFKEKQDAYGGRYDYLYNGTELDEVWSRIKQLAERTARTFVIFNNHKDAKAYANALQLKLRVNPGEPIKAPVGLLQRFPELRAAIHPAGPEQLGFFS